MPTSPAPRRRRAVIVPAGRLTFADAATRVGLSEKELRRRIRPTRDPETCALWAYRLEMTLRPRPGNLLDVIFISEAKLAVWAHVIAPAGVLLMPHAPSGEPDAVDLLD